MNELYECFDDGIFYCNTISEALRGFRYNPDMQVLEVCFESHNEYYSRSTGELMIEIYRFNPVPYDVFESLLDEEKWRIAILRKHEYVGDRYSLGTAFNSLINRNPDYNYMSYSVPAREIDFLDYC